jgi:hypothetical protein
MSHPKERDVALWAGGDLPAGEAARVEDHLAGCPDCRALGETLRAGRAAVESLAAEPIDETALARVRQGLRRRLAEEEARAARRRRSAAAAAWAMAAALVAAALGLGIWYLAGRPEPADELARAERPQPREPDREAVAPPPRELPEAVPERERPETRPAPPAPPPPEPPPPEPPEQRAELASAPAPAGPTESMVIKVVSDDPNVVYYWLVEPEETEDEAVTS